MELLLFTFVVVISPCTTYNAREIGYPCFKPFDNDIGSDRNSLFAIIEVLLI